MFMRMNRASMKLGLKIIWLLFYRILAFVLRLAGMLLRKFLGIMWRLFLPLEYHSIPLIQYIDSSYESDEILHIMLLKYLLHVDDD